MRFDIVEIVVATVLAIRLIRLIENDRDVT